ncbi:MAG: 3-hydroxyacyl-CoA dehydrogenase family protein [Peptococcaceae bacterium]|nr:3-hydroxyacyl-CoA dehydrogenase family protein [Peptococcaceae bacterium]
MEIRTIGILGAGAMGGGIAQVAAQAGFQVKLCDVDMKFVDRALGRIGGFLAKSVEKGKLSEAEKSEILGRIVPCSRMEDFSDAELVIEAIIEDLEAKKEAFQRLDRVCGPEAILATNTSSMSITVIGASTARPGKVAGTHFFNPPPLMRLVEIIRGYATTDDTVRVLCDVAVKMGKTPIEVKKDSPGFVVNRILIAQFLEAIRLVEEGVATPRDVDTAVKLGLNYPMGPFELQDFTGVDIGYYVANYFYEEFKDMRWNPPQALKSLIRAGRLGKKTGAGWYDYGK